MSLSKRSTITDRNKQDAVDSALFRRPIEVAEFFAGVGLVRKALEGEGQFRVSFANDIDRKKQHLYLLNFKGADEFVLSDIRDLRGLHIPTVDLATASFPCTDLSLAGNRKGLHGSQSGAFHEFLRIIKEMGARRPSAVLIENVVGFVTSNNGDDLRTVIKHLNELGYVCDLISIDARRFVPQSRTRVFIIGWRKSFSCHLVGTWRVSSSRPSWIERFVILNAQLQMRPMNLPDLPMSESTIGDVIERFKGDHQAWWSNERKQRFFEALSTLNKGRLEAMMQSSKHVWATAYRRTRVNRAVWEIRADAISGCLRTTRGGSSKQALLEVNNGAFRIRWMTATEYARLQGFDEFHYDPERPADAMFALGDAVCVPVIAWIAREYLSRLFGFTEPPSTIIGEQIPLRFSGAWGTENK